ncbi:MAG: hypothetical protein KDA73_06225 [Rhodobacteraceae bacterium]|nr:hypothetical protein [Paracoccaceae bacterium]
MPGTVRYDTACTEIIPSDDAIREALERILASPEFTASTRRRDFLRFIVEEALAGRAHGLKGSVIAREVYERDSEFSGKSDPVVRLDAGRLRRDLDSYYVGPGAGDPIRISIPKGGYVPVFDVRDEEPISPAQDELSVSSTPEMPPRSAGPAPATPEPRVRSRGRRWRIVAAVGAAVALAVMLALLWLPRGGTPPATPSAIRGYPRVVIMPFTAITPSSEARVLAAGLGIALVDDLQRFNGLRIYTPPEGSDPGRIADRLRDEPGALYVVQGKISAGDTRVQIDTNLRNLRTDEVIWSDAHDIALEPARLTELRGTVAGRIATALGQPYGPIGADLVRTIPDTEPTSVDSYLCVLRAYEHRRNFAAATYAPTLACLEAAVARDPKYSDAWAMLGWLHLDAGRFEYPGAAPIEEEYAQALEAARHAQSLAPDSVLALKALSSIQHYRGRYEESERLARRAVALNPYDPDTLAQLGWRLAMRGNFDEGVPFLQEAIDRSVNPPDWYYHMIAAHYMMNEDYAAMYREAERAALSGRPIAETLLAIAAGALGDREAATAALSRIPPGWDAEQYVRHHGGTEEIVAAVAKGIETARRIADIPARP